MAWSELSQAGLDPVSIRSFIAINLNEDLKTRIGELVTVLKETRSDVKWVKAHNLHLTLKFLGNIEDHQVDSISLAITEIANRFDEFDFSLTGTGIFPDIRRPRVIWIGIKDHDTLLKISREIESAMHHDGFKPEKRSFSPHITIGRVRSLKGIDKLMTELVKYKNRDFGSQSAGSIHLMKSSLKMEGAEYSALSSAPLRRKS